MRSKPVLEMLSRNSKLAQTYQSPPSIMSMVPAMQASGAGVVVLSCADPRIFPDKILGLDDKLKATMVRNAGGRAFDAIRTLSVLQTIGNPGTIVVMHHTDCGMTHFHNKHVRKFVAEHNPKAKELVESLEFGEITEGIEKSLREDIALLKESPLIKQGTEIIGLAYDIQSGILSEVKEKENGL